ncbi:class F sortase [Streptomyces phytohabitans]|uniref:class F sortase n=1 Tax=Streptomyces phytohabitans TaxID=1150371 RepID=UPI00345B522E
MTGPATTGRPSSSPEGGRPRQAVALPPPARRLRTAAAVAVAAGAALAVTGTSALLTTSDGRPEPLAIGTLPVPSADTSGKETPGAPPTGIRVPSLGIAQGLSGLRVQQGGQLDVPEDPSSIGWWSDGPRPGDPGAAVVVGHVDSATGPAVFHGLSSLRPGNKIAIRRDDGTEVVFTVRALRQYEKDSLPGNRVFTTTGPPALRLITCGGTYDRERGEYSDNLVVYATLAH